MGFDYADVMEKSEELKREISESLKNLDNDVLRGNNPVSINEYGWGIDDLCLLPDLRSLTVVKGIFWPERVRRYLEESFRDCPGELYDDYAVE